MGFSETIVKYFYKAKYKVVLLRKLQGCVYFVKSVVKNSITDIVNIQGHQFFIAKSVPAYINNNVRIYLVDYDTGEQFSFSEIKAPLTPDQLDCIIGTRLVKDLTSGILDNKKEKIVWIVMGFAIGAMLAAIICMAIMNGKVEEIMNKFIEYQGMNPLPF